MVSGRITGGSAAGRHWGRLPRGENPGPFRGLLGSAPVTPHLPA